MLCQVCSKNSASVHITEIQQFDIVEPADRPGDSSGKAVEGTTQAEQKHVCESCAQMMNLPNMPLVKKSMVDIWKLLQQSAQRSRKEGGLTCSKCGMTLGEFRSKGRLGCSACYEAFKAHLEPLIERIHNSSHHTGRLPGIEEVAPGRHQKIAELREKLEHAIREEAYEDAAHLRDQLQSLESEGQTS